MDAMTTAKKKIGTRRTIAMAHPLGEHATPDDIQQWQLATINSKLDMVIEELRQMQKNSAKG